LHHIHPPTPFSATSPLKAEPFCFPVLQFCRRKYIKNNSIAFLLVWEKVKLYREILCVVSMHEYITTQIGSSLPVLFTTP
jgi:hypothetical protein